jgi:hypothetical protein
LEAKKALGQGFTMTDYHGVKPYGEWQCISGLDHPSVGTVHYTDFHPEGKTGVSLSKSNH